MENSKTDSAGKEEHRAFRRFAAKRMGIGILLAVVVLWILGTAAGYFPRPKSTPPESASHSVTATSGEKTLPHEEAEVLSVFSEKPGQPTGHAVSPPEMTHQLPQSGQASGSSSGIPAERSTDSKSLPKTSKHESVTAAEHEAQPHAPVRFPVRGMAFVNALVKPLEHELEERFWGWRPNDIVQITDNVNNFQLGVLEVTRRSAVILAERVSRTGSTEAFDRNLENAMNWFMIKPEEYWFPSAESKYKDGLMELEKYFKKLEKKQASFYTRTDNLIPLLMVYEDLLGSCDENLVKQRKKDGTPVSFFMADDYFYYAKGVANTMLTLMEAISVDFDVTVESRRGSEVLHHAIESLQLATKIDPWIVFNSNLSGFFANHRANMAAPISHARFYLGVLIKTLST